MDPKDRPPFLSTARQRAVLQVLVEAGLTESGTYADGERYEDGPPEGLALMLDMALHAAATADHLLGILTWGQRDAETPAMRDLARKVAALGAPPA